MKASLSLSALLVLLAVAACDDKKGTETTAASDAGGAAPKAALADEAIPVPSDFEAEAEAISPENIEAEIAKLEAELDKAN